MFPSQIDNHKLIELCKNGTPDEIRAFLAERGKTTEILNDHFAWQSGPCRASFNLPIVRAVRSGNIEVVKFLLECGADPDKQEDLTQVTARQEATLDHPEILVLFAKFRNGTLGHDAKKTEEKIKKINSIFFEKCHFWSEVFVQSMENAYLAKTVYVDTNTGKYRDIHFHRIEDKDSMHDVNADAVGETIDAAVDELLKIVDFYFSSPDYTIVIE